jgi:hypothetical protein
MTILQDMRERERGINAEIRAINEKVEDEGRDKLLASETRKYAALRTERTGVEARIAQLEQIDERSAAFARGRTELFGPTPTRSMAATRDSRTSGISSRSPSLATLPRSRRPTACVSTPSSSSVHSRISRGSSGQAHTSAPVALRPASTRTAPTVRVVSESRRCG